MYEKKEENFTAYGDISHRVFAVRKKWKYMMPEKVKMLIEYL